MLLETRVVSRKTPGDGRLEITPESARRLAPWGDALPVRVGDAVEARGDARLTAMACTCEKGGGSDGAGSGHQHHFLASDLFRALAPGETVAIELSGNGELHIARAQPT